MKSSNSYSDQYRKFRGLKNREKTDGFSDMTSTEWFLTILFAAIAITAIVFAGPIIGALAIGVGGAATATGLVYATIAVAGVCALKAPSISTAFNKTTSKISSLLGLSDGHQKLKQNSNEINRIKKEIENKVKANQNQARNNYYDNDIIMNNILKNLKKVTDQDKSDPQQIRFKKIKGMIDQLNFDNIENLSPKKTYETLQKLSTIKQAITPELENSFLSKYDPTFKTINEMEPSSRNKILGNDLFPNNDLGLLKNGSFKTNTEKLIDTAVSKFSTEEKQNSLKTQYAAKKNIDLKQLEADINQKIDKLENQGINSKQAKALVYQSYDEELSQTSDKNTKSSNIDYSKILSNSGIEIAGITGISDQISNRATPSNNNAQDHSKKQHGVNK